MTQAKPIIETEIALTMAKKSVNWKIKIEEHFRYKDEIVITWMVESLDDNFKDDRFIRINKKDIPKLIEVLKKFEK